MALVQCPECGKRVSSEADKCPECGYPLHKKRVDSNNTSSSSSSSKTSIGKDDNNVMLILGVVCLFIIPFVGLILIIVALVNKRKANKIKEENRKRSDMEKILIKQAKIDALASIDPTNAEKSKEQIKIVKELDDLD